MRHVEVTVKFIFVILISTPLQTLLITVTTSFKHLKHTVLCVSDITINPLLN